MNKLEQELKELGYEAIKLQNKKFICIKNYDNDDEIEIVIALNNGIIIEDLCEVRIQGNYGFNNYESLNEFQKNLTRALNRMARDIAILKEYEE